MSREEIRFLSDLAARPLSTTVTRYQRLHLSRRRGNAIRQALATASLIEAVPIATRSGQVVLYQLTDEGRSVCSSLGIDPGRRRRTSLEHAYWVMKSAEHFQRKGYEVSREYAVKGNGTVDLLAERPGERVAVEVETGKSDVAGNLAKLRGTAFDRIVVIATSPAAVSVCEKAINERDRDSHASVELLTWLDIS